MKLIYAKIGTQSSSQMIVWSDKEIVKGGKILAMEVSVYKSLHSQYRRLKSCQYWQEYRIDDINEDGFIFLSR